MSKPIFCLLGPTASGKTEIACHWVQQGPFEIISVDSAMIYQEMNIGTAKPTAEILKYAPHHLIDICIPIESYSAAMFCNDVQHLIKEIESRQHIPLLVGGTMMYFRALQQGLHQLPEADASLREELSMQYQEQGALQMHERLKKIDSQSAMRIHPNDSQRIQRALEIYLLTGKTLSEHLNTTPLSQSIQFINLGLFPEDRAWLHQRIERRFHEMLNLGFLEEVCELKHRWQVDQQMPSMRSVGYRQALDYLDGIGDHTTFVEKGVAATRQLAKRQLTWLRSWPNIHYFDPKSPQSASTLLKFVQERGWYE